MLQNAMATVSISRDNYYESKQPQELSEADTTVKWDDDGYRIDTDYFYFDVPLITANYKECLKAHYIDGSAFTKSGLSKQQYMCRLADEHAIFLLGNAIGLQHDKEALSHLRVALTDIDSISLQSLPQPTSLWSI